MAFQPWRTWVALTPHTAAELNQDIRDNGNALFPQGVGSTTWTPVLTASTTNPTVSSAGGRRIQVGGLSMVWGRFVFTTPGSGFYISDLPVAPSGLHNSAVQGSGQTVGSWTIRDNSAARHASGVVILRPEGVWFMASEYLTPVLSHGSHFTVAVDDILSFFAMYPVA